MSIKLMALPDFLRPLRELSQSAAYTHAVFQHSDPLGSAHAIWWPAEQVQASTVILFVPGNPGLCSFYTEFLSEIHAKSDGNLAIMAHAHLGHTPEVIDQDVFKNLKSIALDSQVKSAVEALDAIKLVLKPTHVVLIGHSMGAWVILQVSTGMTDCIEHH